MMMMMMRMGLAERWGRCNEDGVLSGAELNMHCRVKRQVKERERERDKEEKSQ